MQGLEAQYTRTLGAGDAGDRSSELEGGQEVQRLETPKVMEEAGKKHRMSWRKLARNTKCQGGSWVETQNEKEEPGQKHRVTSRKLDRNTE